MITTHVLDTALGRPAAGVPITLERLVPEGTWQVVGGGETDADGRLRTLVPAGSQVEGGTYRLRFDTASYHTSVGVDAFFPSVDVMFVIRGGGHYHVPLLLSPFGYSTYRGS